MAKLEAGMLLLGIGVGYYLPNLPVPAEFLNPYFGLIFVIAGVLVMLKA